MKQLDAKQQSVVDAVVVRRESVFLTGAAGVGKTHCIAAVVRMAVARRLVVALTASTGLAAGALAVDGVNVQPSTLHSFAGIGADNHTTSREQVVRRVVANDFARRRWTSVDVLVVDEVSMLSPELFDLLDIVARAARRRPHQPFGGITLLLVGDFFQLPPVHNARPGSQEFCFETKAWRGVVQRHVLLERAYRQRGDDALVRILDEVRHGRLSRESERLLRTRTFDVLFADLQQLAGLPADTTADVDIDELNARLAREKRTPPPHLRTMLCAVEPTTLVATNAEVDEINGDNLAQLVEGVQTVHHYEAQIECRVPRGANSSVQRRALGDAMRTGCRADQRLTLCVGAQVMLLANLTPTLTNGTRGRVVGFVQENSCKRKRQEQADRPAIDRALLARCCCSVESLVWPQVKFDNGETHVVRAHAWRRHSCSRGTHASSASAMLVQVPLKLAWAVSIHKAQGMSISLLRVDLARLFARGQAYVALSRVRSLDGLELAEPIDAAAVSGRLGPHPKVLAYYKCIKSVP